jgi:eukaryotic-like serine/threonine-protein kinase
MLPERSSQDDGAAPPGASITRCWTCGRRVSGAPPGCPAHGPIQRSDPAAVETTQVSAIALPRFSRYRAKRVIGQGGFGTVFEAESEAGKRVAIKLARDDHPDAYHQLMNEIKVLIDVGPPAAPSVYGWDMLEDGAPYVIMEYLEGQTLAQRLVDGAEPIRIPLACSLGLSILEALEAVHARGYVHRDLKPENIFIGPDQKARIVDFGLVTRVAEAAPSLETTEGAAVGTADYMAPEQCEGRRDIDARADLYAIGVVLFELITGRPPFWGPRAVVQQCHRSYRPPRLSAMLPGTFIPKALEDVVRRCLAKDRQERFDSAAELRVALERATSDDEGRPTPIPTLRGPGGASGSTRASAPGERRTVGLLFFEADADVLAIQKKLAPFGGQLAHAAGGRYVMVHGQEASENPARKARRVAQEMLRRGLCTRVRLDLASVLVQTRPDGSKRFLSPLFARSNRFPSDGDPLGLSVAPAAAAVLPSAPGSSSSVPPSKRPEDSLPPVSGTSPEREILAPESGYEPLIGRDAVVCSLVEGASRAISQALPTVVSVIAEGGYGKSHLASVLVGKLHELDLTVEVIALRAQEPAFGGADQTIGDLLSRILDLPASAPPDGGAELLRERLGFIAATGVEAAVALALGWAAPGTSGSTPWKGLGTLEAAPGALRSALAMAAGEALRRRASARPLLLVLDDAQFADDAMLSALEYAALAEARAPLWICALGRPAFKQQRPSWGERAARREAHHLGPLDDASAASLCRRLLLPVENVPDSALRRLVERAQAIPLVLVELVRGLKREGLVRRHPGSDEWYLATDEIDHVPDLPLIEWFALREIDALTPTLQAHARLFALLGDDVVPEDVDGVLRGLERQGGAAEFPLDVKIAIQRLLAAGVLTSRRRGRIGFRHALVREAIAKELTQELRRKIHVAAAEHYRDAEPGAATERRLSQLAFHSAHAGLAALAEHAYLELAERMRGKHAYMEAERLYSRALEQPCGADDNPRASVYQRRGLMRYRLGHYHDAIVDLSRAREMANRKGDVAAEIEILLDEATALDWMDEYKKSEERVERARALISKVRSPLLEARLLLGSGRSLHRGSREEEAAALVERAAAAAEAQGDEGYETLVIALLMLGFILPGIGRLDDARRALDRGIALCESHGDTLHLAGIINNRALLWAYLGDKARMIADLKRVLSLARELGQGTLELAGEFNLGEYLFCMDEVDASEPHVLRAIELERRRTGDDGRPVVALLEARFRLYRGEEEVARAIVARIRERLSEAEAKGEADKLMAPSEEVLCSMIELSIRDAGAAMWDELEARSARYSVGQEQIEVLEARALAALRRGRAESARLKLEQALDLASRIPNVMGSRLRRWLDEARRIEGPSALGPA